MTDHQSIDAGLAVQSHDASRGAAGLMDLRELIKSLQPELDPSRFYFCSSRQLPTDLLSQAFAVVKEDEGWTLVLSEQALPDLDDVAMDVHAQWVQSSAAFCRITLNVHSSLEAVGLTAAVATALASHHISCNMLAGYYHDHLFVRQDHAEQAFALLQQLSADMRRMPA